MKYKAVIFDLRHSSGGGHQQLVEWIKLFTGKTPAVNEAFLTRNNALRTLQNFGGFEYAAMGRENSKTWYHNGHETSNKIPLIILTDKSCGSAVEEACLYLRTIENSVVIGSNTKGCALGGSVQTYYLPYSGVQFAIGGFMEFQGEAKNIDGLGYEPDIWCNPEDALTSALMFLQYYGLADQQSVQPLYRESTPPANLRILWHGSEILPGQGFGDILIETPGRIGIVIEVKYAERDMLEKGCAQALEQIEKNCYTARLKEDGMKSILKYGIAFYKKHCKVSIG